MRGNPVRSRTPATGAGSIPAYAGEPKIANDFRLTRWVYPRVCGGTRRNGRRRETHYGLSPRMRGNPTPMTVPTLRPRSIPAYAGEPPLYGNIGKCDAVYPRVCGGTNPPILSPRMAGLSPRMRGNRAVRGYPAFESGSIPAYAGEPGRTDPGRPRAAVYPRVCGGTEAYPAAGKMFRGLSPRMRGNPRHGEPQRGFPRSIPAYAGEPTCRRSWARATTVYPRVCGGTSHEALLPVPIPGLSPRMRGNRRRCRPRRRPAGSIPAYAGEPQDWRAACRPF